MVFSLHLDAQFPRGDALQLYHRVVIDDGGLDNLVLTVKVKADADLPTLQNFADRSAANSPVLNSLKARAKVVVEKI